jgi:hypothetical protein
MSNLLTAAEVAARADADRARAEIPRARERARRDALTDFWARAQSAVLRWHDGEISSGEIQGTWTPCRA